MRLRRHLLGLGAMTLGLALIAGHADAQSRLDRARADRLERLTPSTIERPARVGVMQERPRTLRGAASVTDPRFRNYDDRAGDRYRDPRERLQIQPAQLQQEPQPERLSIQDRLHDQRLQRERRFQEMRRQRELEMHQSALRQRRQILDPNDSVQRDRSPTAETGDARHVRAGRRRSVDPEEERNARLYNAQVHGRERQTLRDREAGVPGDTLQLRRGEQHETAEWDEFSGMSRSMQLRYRQPSSVDERQQPASVRPLPGDQAEAGIPSETDLMQEPGAVTGDTTDSTFGQWYDSETPAPDSTPEPTP